MAPIVRTSQQLQTLFHDNDVAEISAGDGRDLVVTVFGFAAPRDPTPDDDRVNSAGSGQFFDVGSVWLNLTTQNEWRCYSGLPHLAIWQMTGGAGGGGGGGGGTVTSIVAQQGTRTASGFPIVSTGAIWGDEPVSITTSDMTLTGFRGWLVGVVGDGLHFLAPDGTPPLPGNGFYVDCKTVTSGGVQHVQGTTDSAIFSGGGLSWLNKAAGGPGLGSFVLMAGDVVRLVCSGSEYQVLGLPIFHGLTMSASQQGPVPPGTTWTVNWDGGDDLGLGAFGAQEVLPFQTGFASTRRCPVTGIYEFEYRIWWQGGPGPGSIQQFIEITANILLNGVTVLRSFTVDLSVEVNPLTANPGWSSGYITDKTYFYGDVNDDVSVQVAVGGVDVVGGSFGSLWGTACLRLVGY